MRLESPLLLGRSRVLLYTRDDIVSHQRIEAFRQILDIGLREPPVGDREFFFQIVVLLGYTDITEEHSYPLPFLPRLSVNITFSPVAN